MNARFAFQAVRGFRVNALASLALVAVTLGACGSSNKDMLSGSVPFSTDYNSIVLQRENSSVAVEYLNSGGTIVAELVVNLDGIVQVAGTTIDLTQVADGEPRGYLQRVDTTTTEYAIARGTITFNQSPDVGASISGTFFTTLGGSSAGQTLNGTFSGTVTGFAGDGGS